MFYVYTELLNSNDKNQTELHASTWVNLANIISEWKKQDTKEYILDRDVNFKNRPKIHMMLEVRSLLPGVCV